MLISLNHIEIVSHLWTNGWLKNECINQCMRETNKEHARFMNGRHKIESSASRYDIKNWIWIDLLIRFSISIIYFWQSKLYSCIQRYFLIHKLHFINSIFVFVCCCYCWLTRPKKGQMWKKQQMSTFSTNTTFLTFPYCCSYCHCDTQIRYYVLRAPKLFISNKPSAIR